MVLVYRSIEHLSLLTRRKTITVPLNRTSTKHQHTSTKITMGDICTPENHELRNRKPSPSPVSEQYLIVAPTEDELSHHRKSTAGDPLPNASNISSFRSLIATNKAATDIILSPSTSPETPLFYTKNGSLKRHSPSVTIHHATKGGAVLGTLKLGWGRDNTFGLGDPAKEGDLEWFNLRRTSEWTHATYEFEWRDKIYVWQRTKQRVFSDQPNMELFVKGTSGTVLGVYKGKILFSSPSGSGI